MCANWFREKILGNSLAEKSARHEGPEKIRQTAVIVSASVTKGSLRLLDHGYSVLQLCARIDTEYAQRLVCYTTLVVRLSSEVTCVRTDCIWGKVPGHNIEAISQYEGSATVTAVLLSSMCVLGSGSIAYRILRSLDLST